MSDIQPVLDGAPTEPAPEADPFDTGADTFPRSYVEKLRNEAADYRTKYAPYRDTFGDEIDPDVKDYLLDLNRLLISPDKKAAVSELRDLLKTLDPDSAEGKAVEAAIDDAIDPDAPLTLKQWEKYEAGRAAKNKAEQDVASIYDEAKALSTPWANYDKDGDQYGDVPSLLFVATTKFKGDLKAAHDFREQRFTSAVNAEVERRLGEIKTGASKWAPVIVSSTTPAQESESPKTFSEARKRANSRLAKILDGGI